MAHHKDLAVWNKGIDFVAEIYKATENFPKHELFGLTSQMRRSVVSIPSNIAEGCGRNTNKELIHFLYIALGSSSELETQLIISHKLNYLEKSKCDDLLNKLVEIIKMTTSLIKSIKLRLIAN